MAEERRAKAHCDKIFRYLSCSTHGRTGNDNNLECTSRWNCEHLETTMGIVTIIYGWKIRVLVLTHKLMCLILLTAMTPLVIMWFIPVIIKHDYNDVHLDVITAKVLTLINCIECLRRHEIALPASASNWMICDVVSPPHSLIALAPVMD